MPGHSGWIPCRSRNNFDLKASSALSEHRALRIPNISGSTTILLSNGWPSLLKLTLALQGSVSLLPDFKAGRTDPVHCWPIGIRPRDVQGYHGRRQPSINRVVADASGFLTLIQSGDRPIFVRSSVATSI
jgi:hypothetical protein